MSDSLRLHESQHARPPCPSPTPGVYSDSCPLSRWCHPAISSSVIPFSSCPQPLSALGSFPMSPLFAWGGQSIGFRKQYQTIFGGSNITADGDCSHEIKRRLLLGKKFMTNLDSILKSRDITLPTKVHLVKAMVFPVVLYGCESWTGKKERFYRHLKRELLH